MLEGLGFAGRVPSPTYTLLEHYSLAEIGLDLVHVDLYRIEAGPSAGDALETLGLRDWLARERHWVVIEWLERAPELAARCDVSIAIEPVSATARRVAVDVSASVDPAVLGQLRKISDDSSS